MALPQQKYRELVFQVLYSNYLESQDPEEIRSLMMSQLAVTKRNVKEAQLRVEEVLKVRDEIDAVISQTSTAFALDRIQTVELNILRLGMYELMYDSEIPPKVAISEAVRLTRKFSTPEASHFVNAVLDAHYKRSLGVEGDLCFLEQTTELLAASEDLAAVAAEEQGDAELGVDEEKAAQ